MFVFVSLFADIFIYIFFIFSDGPNFRKAIAKAPPGFKGNDVSFISARSKFIDAIQDGRESRFTDNPGILDSSSVFNPSHFPSAKEEAKGTLYTGIVFHTNSNKYNI